MWEVCPFGLAQTMAKQHRPIRVIEQREHQFLAAQEPQTTLRHANLVKRINLVPYSAISSLECWNVTIIRALRKSDGVCSCVYETHRKEWIEGFIEHFWIRLKGLFT